MQQEIACGRIIYKGKIIKYNKTNFKYKQIKMIVCDMTTFIRFKNYNYIVCLIHKLIINNNCKIVVLL